MTNFSRASLASLERIVEENLENSEKAFGLAVQALSEIRDRAAWRPKYPSITAYIRARFGVARTHSYRLLDHLEVCLNLSPMGDAPPPERHTRRLGELKDPADQRTAYRGAQRAAAAGGSPVLQRHIDESTKRMAATATIEDPAKRKQAQAAALDEFKKEQEGEPQHRVQRPRMHKFMGHAEQQRKLMLCSEPGEVAAMYLTGLAPFIECVERLGISSQQKARLAARLQAAVDMLE